MIRISFPQKKDEIDDLYIQIIFFVEIITLHTKYVDSLKIFIKIKKINLVQLTFKIYVILNKSKFHFFKTTSFL